MPARKQSLWPWVVLMGVALLLIAAGCGSLAEEQGETNRTDPFYNRMEAGQGAVIEWSGYARGHQPGQESTFALTIYDGSPDTWQGRYCVQLLDRHSLVATLEQEGFSLQRGESWVRQVVVRFPDGLADGAYGLALIFPGRLSSVTTIQVGKGSDTFGGPWPEPVCQ
jgi:hypothetical protein